MTCDAWGRFTLLLYGAAFRIARVCVQVCRPTGVLDPWVEVRGTRGQLADVLAEVRGCIARGEAITEPRAVSRGGVALQTFSAAAAAAT